MAALQALADRENKSTALRELRILEQLGSHVSNSATAVDLACTLLPLLATSFSGGRKGGGGRLGEVGMERCLASLAALWGRLSALGASREVPEEHLSKAAGVLAPYAGSLSSPSARGALCRAYQALGALLPCLITPADLLSRLNSQSTDELDAPDYDARLGAYTELKAPLWVSMTAPGAAASLLHHCFRDLRSPEDLALRHGAAGALTEFLRAAEGGKTGEEAPLQSLVLKLFYPQVRPLPLVSLLPPLLSFS